MINDKKKEGMTMADKRLNSKLEPYYMEVLFLKSRDETYNDILQYLDQRYSLKVSHSTLFNFLKVREKRGILPVELSQSRANTKQVPKETKYINNVSDDSTIQKLKSLIN